VVAALALTGDPRAASVLAAYLGYDWADMRWKAAAGLVRIGAPAVPLLIAASASDQPLVRRNALRCLGRIGAPEARPVLLEALDDDDRLVRRQAIVAMAGLVTAGDVPRFKELLRKERWDDALLATKTMVRVGTEGMEALTEMALREGNPAAAYGIAARGDERGREILLELLGLEGTASQDAVEYLRELGDKRCVPYLVERLRRTGGERGMSIALSLARVEGAEVTRALIDVLASGDKLTRRGALRAMAERQDPALIDPLIECIAREPDQKNRGIAARALERLGEQALEALQSALDEDRIQGKHQRSTAQRALWNAGMRHHPSYPD
jgi:HEAT repeat protein